MKNHNQNRHAIVIGGGMAGLVTGKVLTKHFDKVTIIERDHFPASPESRKGVPQGRHLHGLLARGLLVLEELFPGLERDLDAAGAPSLDHGLEALVCYPIGWNTPFRSGIMLRSCSRPLLEWHVHRHLMANENVHFLERCRVIGLLSDASKTTVTGVQVRFHSGSEEALQADLIVDASGRTSRAPKWLETLGYPLVQETTIDPLLGYASGWYQPPTNFQGDWKLLGISFRYPDNPRAGAISVIEGGRWIVLLAGMGREYPPTDEAGFLDFAHGLANPRIYEALKDAQPISPIYGYRQTSNHQRHYEKLPRWPEHFVALGDAVCAFNPFYAQGMTVSALGALALDAELEQQRLSHANFDLTGLGQRFQKQLAKVNTIPWLMSTGQDRRWANREGDANPSLRDKLTQGYIARIMQVGQKNPNVRRAFIEVVHMLKPPSALIHPKIMLQVLRQSVMRRTL